MRKKIIFLIASFFYCSFLTVWQNEFLIAQNEQFDWHVWFCSFYSFRKCHEKENRGKKSADFCSCCFQFYKCFWWLRLDQNVLSVCFASFFLVFTFLKHFFYDMSSPIIFSRVCKFAVWGWIQSTKPERKSFSFFCKYLEFQAKNPPQKFSNIFFVEKKA